MSLIARWTVVANGPDGFVEGFYAETDLPDAELVLASEYDALAQQLAGAVAENEKLRAELHFAGERIRERDRDIEVLRIEIARLFTRRGQS